LKLTDIDSKRMTVKVSDGKGGKDRYSILSQTTLEFLRQYWKKGDGMATAKRFSSSIRNNQNSLILT
ncbi:MAG: hypothetical protein ACLQSX_00925, partial [Smithella sp.]